jgi:excinuclease ABC subunit C
LRPQLQPKLDALPVSPGVYIFTNSSGEIIYVGKAKSLRSRVRTYLQPAAHGDYKGEALRSEIFDLDVNVCSSEVDALILESVLIKKHRPRYNVLLRDDKSYPYIVVTINDEYPTVAMTRARRRPGNRYYGPYINARAARNTIRSLNKVFPLRHCSGRQPGRRGGSPCLYYDMKMCLGPCRGTVDPAEYAGYVKLFCDFLEGRHRQVMTDLETRMKAAAREQEYELAARLRNQIESAQEVLRHHRSLSVSTVDYDVIGVFSDASTACFSVARNRGGVHLGNLCLFMDLEGITPSGELVTEFLKQYYDQAASIPAQVIVPVPVEDEAVLAKWLSDARGSAVEIRIPRRGKKKSEIVLAESNAKVAMEGVNITRSRDSERVEKALAELKDNLGLSSYPLRIECFDISTLAGSASVGSMVVFQDGLPVRNQYRKFRIKYTPGVDDVGMMKEILYRRFKNYSEQKGEEDGESFSRRPDLVVLDGGKGQLGAAIEVLRVLGVEGVEVGALAKRLEDVYRPGAKSPIVLPRRSEALFLLQRIRDEAHRVAVMYHRTIMEKSTGSSWLDQIAGVGPGRKRALVKHFGSPARVAEASRDELEAVPGLPSKVARAVYESARSREKRPG